MLNDPRLPGLNLAIEELTRLRDSILCETDVDFDDQLRHIIRTQGMIPAIKHCRTSTGNGLRECLHYCEALS